MDDFDPTRRAATPAGTEGASQGGMDPEGLMPADPELHEEAASPAGTADAVADAIVSPHDQPVEGGAEEAEDDPLARR